MNILGISVGTTRTGVCVLQKDTLIDWNIHNYRYAWSKDKLDSIINQYKRYVVKYRIKAIVIKIPQLKKHSDTITLLLNQIELMAKEYDCAFDFTTKTEIKHTMSLKNSREIVEFTRLLYPELITVFEKGSKNRHSYYRKIYEAVISAFIYNERQRVRALQKERTTE